MLMMSIPVTRYIVAVIAVILLIGYTLSHTQRYDRSRDRIIGYTILFVGGIGVMSFPLVYLTSNSPLYIASTGVLGFVSVLLGWYHSQTQSVQSLKPITETALITSIIYTLVVAIPLFRRPLIELVTIHTTAILSLWYDVSIQNGQLYGYMSEIVFYNQNPQLITFIDIACTGIGAFAVVCGLTIHTTLPTSKKWILVVISGMIIYILNILRNVFVAAAFAEQWFNTPLTQSIFGYDENVELVSFVVAETYISQLLSAFLLGIIVYSIAMRTTIFEELLADIRTDLMTMKTMYELFQERLF